MDDDRWLYVEFKRDRRLRAAALRLPFDRRRWPEYDVHVALAVPYAPHWRTGMPRNAEELTRLQDVEYRMIGTLAGHGALVATETGDATRTIHLYIRGGGPMEASFRTREANGRKGGMTASVQHDPEWERVAHLAAHAARAA